MNAHSQFPRHSWNLHQSRKESPIPIAVIDFDYRVTSGETPDVTTDYRMRLEAFMSAIRSDLASSGKYRLVAISCEGGPQLSAQNSLDFLLKQSIAWRHARALDRAFLLNPAGSEAVAGSCW